MRSKRSNTFLMRYSYLFTAIFIFVLLLPGISKGENESRKYISVGPAIVSVSGDFDGVTFVSGGGSIEVLPELDTTTGMKYALGLKSESFGMAKSFGMAISYIRSDHDGQWGGLDYSSRYRSYNFDVQFYTREMSRVHPFGILGLNYHTITVEDGSFDGFSFKDAKFRAGAFRFGVGADVRLHDRLVLSASSVYRWGTLTSVKGFASGTLENMDSNGFTHALEAKFFFN